MLTMVGWDVVLVGRPIFSQVSFVGMIVGVSCAMCDCWDDYCRVGAKMLKKAIYGVS